MLKRILNYQTLYDIIKKYNVKVYFYHGGYTMIDKVREIADLFKSIENKLSMAEYINDQEKYIALIKEHKRLAPISEKYDEYLKCSSSIEDLRGIVEVGDDELVDMAEEELKIETGQIGRAHV